MRLLKECLPNSIVVILVLALFFVPVAAELNFTQTDDGKTLISNGTYWILWNPIDDDHKVGDQFFINGTTNLSSGTIIIGEFFDPNIYCRTKVCEKLGSGFGKEIVVESNGVSRDNTVSFFINTTGFQNSIYFFQFTVLSSSIPSEKDAFYSDHLVNSNILLSAKEDGISTKPTTSPISFTVICGAILISIYIFFSIQRNEKRGRLK